MDLVLDAEDRAGRERLCRSIARRDGKVVDALRAQRAQARRPDTTVIQLRAPSTASNGSMS